MGENILVVSQDCEGQLGGNVQGYTGYSRITGLIEPPGWDCLRYPRILSIAGLIEPPG